MIICYVSRPTYFLGLIKTFGVASQVKVLLGLSLSGSSNTPTHYSAFWAYLCNRLIGLVQPSRPVSILVQRWAQSPILEYLCLIYPVVSFKILQMNKYTKQKKSKFYFHTNKCYFCIIGTKILIFDVILCIII